MSPSETPEIPPTALTQFFVGDCGLRAWGKRSTFSTPPPSASGGADFGAIRFAYSLQPADLCASLADPTGRPADGDSYTRAFDESVTLLVVGYGYGGDWVISTGGNLTRWIVI